MDAGKRLLQTGSSAARTRCRTGFSMSKPFYMPKISSITCKILKKKNGKRFVYERRETVAPNCHE